MPVRSDPPESVRLVAARIPRTEEEKIHRISCVFSFRCYDGFFLSWNLLRSARTQPAMRCPRSRTMLSGAGLRCRRHLHCARHRSAGESPDPATLCEREDTGMESCVVESTGVKSGVFPLPPDLTKTQQTGHQAGVRLSEDPRRREHTDFRIRPEHVVGRGMRGDRPKSMFPPNSTKSRPKPGLCLHSDGSPKAPVAKIIIWLKNPACSPSC